MKRGKSKRPVTSISFLENSREAEKKMPQVKIK